MPQRAWQNGDDFRNGRLGVTGGEEMVFDNSDVDSSRLYAAGGVAYSYEGTFKREVSPRFTWRRHSGNVHGVYKPGCKAAASLHTA